MPVLNSDIAEAFREMADLLEIEGANQFRVRAYRNAARTIEELPTNVRDMVESGKDLTDLSGIGKELAEKIKTMVETGELSQLKKLEDRTPAELAKMLTIEGLGPKRVQAIHDHLGIETLADLKAAAERGEIEDVPGLGKKTQEDILKALEDIEKGETRTRIDLAEEAAAPLVAYLANDEHVERVEVAGSYRRRRATVGDLDILAISDIGGATIERFAEYEDVTDVVSKGSTRSTVILRSGLQVDLRVVPEESYGAALLYFTGSKAHNIKLRNMAVDRDLKINEYGVFEVKNGEEGKRVAGETETGIYELLGLSYVEPELREDHGEVAAAQKHELPGLVTLDDIRGDLQMHTTASDGKASLKEMVQAARERGYDYVAVTDHSTLVSVTQGLNADALAKRIDEIDGLNEGLDGIRVLKGIEVDIREDGSLDLPDDVLSKLDVCLISVHTRFNLPRDKQTERIIRAMDNPNVHILAHPTGRLIQRRGSRLQREPYDVDLERLMEAALDRGCYMEINAHPERLDLDGVHAKMAKEMGLKLAISTDAHSISSLAYMHYGIDQARRGWLTPSDVLNTRSWRDLKVLLKRS